MHVLPFVLLFVLVTVCSSSFDPDLPPYVEEGHVIEKRQREPRRRPLAPRRQMKGQRQPIRPSRRRPHQSYTNPYPHQEPPFRPPDY
uniref:Uncharacterized protein n=1 Tax=Trichuris muris TaxID=70415 RepID=A0A5S6QRK1_TRIMR